MIKILKKIIQFKTLIFLSSFLVFASCDKKAEGNKKNINGKVVVKVFSSLTCPHCANFHKEVVVKLKEQYIDKKIVEFKHHGFPLDMAALNTEKILYCFEDEEKQFNFLTNIYKKQKNWAVGSDINIINNSIKIIGKELGLDDNMMDKCLVDKKIEEQILDERINAQKNYKIKSTPTIYINEKQYKGDYDFKKFKKELDKQF